MAAEFKVTSDEQGLFHFVYFNGRGERLMSGPTFSDRRLTDQAIQEVRVGSMMSQFISKGQTADGDLYFRISNQNGETVAQSVTFDNEMVFNNALHQVRDGACVATVTYE
ncbi:MAG: DUF1508 domain-containing protein [Oceanospirillaceae bacterium]|nr:DUF1508 domain-containing protein [Oceanospirillaceae bacterium]